MAGANGSVAYADIGTGVAVAVMRNRFAIGDFTSATRFGRLVAGSSPSSRAPRGPRGAANRRHFREEAP